MTDRQWDERLLRYTDGQWGKAEELDAEIVAPLREALRRLVEEAGVFDNGLTVFDPSREAWQQAQEALFPSGLEEALNSKDAEPDPYLRDD